MWHSHLARASLREGRKFKRVATNILRTAEDPVLVFIRSIGVRTASISMYYVYILQSQKTGKLYIGYTDNLNRRIEEHNTGRGGQYTRYNGPWKLVYSEHHWDRSSAIIRERYLKSTRGSQEKKKLAGILTK